MSSAVKLFLTIIAVVGVGLGIGWWATRAPNRPVAAPVPPTNLSSPNLSTDPVPISPRGAKQGSSNVTPGTPVIAVHTVSPVGANGVVTNWEDKVDEILSAEGEESAKATQMLELFPRLPEDGQVEVAQHLSNLLPDKEYSALGAYLTNAALAEPVLDVLVADLLNRPNEVKLPLLLDIARTEQHPKATEAHDILQLFLEEDYGKDWGRWQTKMQQWLQENPD